MLFIGCQGMGMRGSIRESRWGRVKGVRGLGAGGKHAEGMLEVGGHGKNWHQRDESSL